MDTFWSYVAALAPFLFAAFAFYIIIKNMITSDRNERIAQRKWEAEHGRMQDDGSAAQAPASKVESPDGSPANPSS